PDGLAAGARHEQALVAVDLQAGGLPAVAARDEDLALAAAQAALVDRAGGARAGEERVPLAGGDALGLEAGRERDHVGPLALARALAAVRGGRDGDRGADHERHRDKNRSHGDSGTPSGWTMGTTCTHTHPSRLRFCDL